MPDFTAPEIVAGYVRASTDRQEDSPHVQWSIIDAYCKKHNYVIPPELRFTDFDVSSSIETPRRPDGSKLFKSVLDRKRRLFNKVVIVRLDRTFRDILDQEQTFRAFAKAGVEFIGAKHNLSRATAQERRNLAYDGVSAQYEREITGERVKEHNVKRHEDGLQPCGYPSLGLSRVKASDGPLEIDPVGLASVIRVFEIFAASAGNIRATARQLNDEGVPTRRAARWHTAIVRHTVGAPNYRQFSYYNGELIHKPELIPPTIPADLLARVDGLLTAMYGHWHVGTANPNAKPKMYARSTYSGLLRCGRCGEPMDFHGSSVRRPMFRCRSQIKITEVSCRSTDFNADTLDYLVGQAIKEALLQYTGVSTGTRSGRVSRAPIDVTAKIAAIEESRKRALSLYVDGAITREDWERQVARLDAESAKLSAVNDVVTTVPLLGARDAADVLARWEDIWIPVFDSMPKRDLLTRVFGIGKGDIVGLRTKDEKHRYQGEFWVEVNAPALGGQLPRITRIGSSVPIRECS